MPREKGQVYGVAGFYLSGADPQLARGLSTHRLVISDRQSPLHFGSQSDQYMNGFAPIDIEVAAYLHGRRW